MPARFWFAEERDIAHPRRRNLPTTVHRQTECPECGNSGLRHVLVQNAEGIMPFEHDGLRFSWAREGKVPAHRFPKFAEAERALKAHKDNARWRMRVSDLRWGMLVSGTGDPRATQRFNTALRKAWKLD